MQLDQQTLLMLILGVVCIGALGYVFMAPTSQKKASQRAAGLSGNSRTAQRTGGKGQQENTKDRRKHIQESLRKMEDAQKERAEKQKLSLSQKIEQAGLNISERDFYVASVICGIGCALVGFISGQAMHVIGMMTFVGALGLPRWGLFFLKSRRQKKFLTEFTGAIDVIVRGVKSGLPVHECLKIVSKDAEEPVRAEFALMIEGLRIGLSLDQVLERMYDRMPLPEVNFFSIVLIIQRQTGGNLAEALGNLGTVLRNRKLMQGKVSALSMEAKASAVILGSLPFMVGGMVHMSSPEYLEPLWNTQMGNFILLGSGLWMSIGIFIMKNMISIKV
ncbi:type II secretion system F family protein [Parvularcula flava]|uniref:Pilus assembly protein n=1 Tax=Aquisalinus luteolus TaxID=1566827 RepID=A0A8J3EUF3_9PROT|nr:type II secretion system F family protein [Aquisalinus luteolus]NHK27961.1 type II secretion system F family protein [Aquisalinus luteolus]GGH97055.1 pilus assembly protein [Aquisalinus luteolus]